MEHSWNLRIDLTKPLVCLTASFLATGGLIISKCMHGLQACLFKYITVAFVAIL